MSNRDDLEQQLLASMNDHIAIYNSAIPVARELSESYDLSNESQNKMEQLGKWMMEAQLIEKTTVELRTTWSNEFRGQSAAIQHASQRLVGLIEELMELTTRVEEKAQQFKNNLMPQMSQQLQFRKAHAAYSSQ